MNTTAIKGKKGRIGVLTILVLALFIIIAIFMILPPGKGEISQFRDEGGIIIEGSIAEKTYIEVDGTKLGLIIVGKDQTKPVMLFLGGGPGIPQYFLEDTYPTGISEEFVVCYLEYRGTSLSYHSNLQPEEMTTDRYLDDVEAVTNYLIQRFDKEKIYLMGHSFGTFLGIQMAYNHPEYYEAYIAMSQLTNPRESEKIAAKYMEDQYRELGNTKKVKEFEKQSSFSDDEAYQEYFNSLLRDESMHELGVGTMHTMKSVISGIFLPSLRCKAYSTKERIAIWQGKNFMAATPVGLERTKYNVFENITSLEIPIYFFAGEYDYTCCYSLQKKYYELIQAPLKAFYTFENSAHSPLYEEPKKAMNIIGKDVLEEKTSLSDHK